MIAVAARTYQTRLFACDKAGTRLSAIDRWSRSPARLPDCRRRLQAWPALGDWAGGPDIPAAAPSPGVSWFARAGALFHRDCFPSAGNASLLFHVPRHMAAENLAGRATNVMPSLTVVSPAGWRRPFSLTGRHTLAEHSPALPHRTRPTAFRARNDRNGTCFAQHSSLRSFLFPSTLPLRLFHQARAWPALGPSPPPSQAKPMIGDRRT